MRSGRQFVPLFLSEKKRLSCNQPARQQTRCNTRPDFSSAPLSASRKIRSTVRPAFPIRKKRLSCNQPARQQTRCNTRPDFSAPHNQRLTLFRLNFYAPYFLSADSDFFPFLTKRFSGDGFSLFLVGKHQEKHALQTKNDNGHFSVPVSAGQTFPGTLHPVNRIRHPVAAFSRQGANPGHSRRKRGSLQIILPRRHIGKKNSPSLANGEFSDNPEIYHGSLYSRAGSFRRSRFVAPVFSQKLRRVPFN